MLWALITLKQGFFIVELFAPQKIVPLVISIAKKQVYLFSILIHGIKED